MQIEDLEIFENVAYIMAYHADHSIPGTIDDWLDEFEMFSIYQVLPEILELWGANTEYHSVTLSNRNCLKARPALVGSVPAFSTR